MTAPARFVFFGAEGEYVLGPLAQAMTARGFDCVEIVARPGFDAAAAITALPQHDGRTVLLTSTHFLHDTESMAEFLGVPGYPSLPAVMERLRPDLLVYYPHDLSTPVLWDEHGYLHRIGLYLAATDAELALRRQVEVVPVGWIKLRPATAKAERRGRGLWLCMGTETVIRKVGARRTFDQYRPHLRDWCTMKLPPYANCRAMEDMLRAAGIAVIDCFEPPPAHVPHYELVVSNGPSSVVREAGLMGKPVFVVTHRDLFPQDYLREMQDFADMPNVRFVPSLDDIPAQLADVPARLRPFDEARAIAAILARLERAC